MEQQAEYTAEKWFRCLECGAEVFEIVEVDGRWLVKCLLPVKAYHLEAVCPVCGQLVEYWNKSVIVKFGGVVDNHVKNP